MNTALAASTGRSRAASATVPVDLGSVGTLASITSAVDRAALAVRRIETKQANERDHQALKSILVILEDAADAEKHPRIPVTTTQRRMSPIFAAVGEAVSDLDVKSRETPYRRLTAAFKEAAKGTVSTATTSDLRAFLRRLSTSLQQTIDTEVGPSCIRDTWTTIDL